jgi:hypothetical protein
LDKIQGPPTTGLAYLQEAVTKTAAAVRSTGKRFRRVTQVGTSWAVVDRVASTRRIRQPDGTILTRASSAKDPLIRMAPEGTIDAFLRTVSFYEGSAPVARLHYYATHPQSLYGDGRVSYDVPGLARERLEKETGVLQIYFNGCGGDVAMGKYNDYTPQGRQELANRVYDAMARSVAKVRLTPVGPVHWATAPAPCLPPRDPAYGEARCQEVLKDARAPKAERIKSAMLLAWNERVRAGRQVEISCMSLGPVRLLHLPGEPFVEYQLYAQRAGADAFVAVAGYGDCGMWYIGTDQAYADRGGYEQTWSFVGPSEGLLKKTIAGLLAKNGGN